MNPVKIEALEDRRLLSAVIDATNTLLIKGTARADTIVIGADATSVGVTINGVTQHFDKGTFSAITVKAGGGNDTVTVDETYGNTGMGLRVEGAGGGDQIRGSSFNDTLLGGDGLDYIFGGAGNDTITGQGGKGYLWGEAGNDTITGGNAGDALYGGDGDDALYGLGGYDVLEGGTGNNITNAGAGASTINNPNAAGAHPMALIGTSPTGGGGVASPNRFISTPFGLNVDDIRNSYQFGSLTDPTFTNRGAGQGIAIIGAYDTPTVLNDVNVFSAANGLPAMDGTQLQVIYATGIRPSTDPTVVGDGTGVIQLNPWSGEANLDVQWAHAIAPEATIYLVESASNLHTDIVDAIQVASRLLKQNHGGGVVSMSFGVDETLAQSPLYEKVLNKPGFKNITYVASSGDEAGVLSYPATSPRVVAVGGSVLEFSNGVQLPDTAWSQGGGGESSLFTLPPYQTNLDYSVGGSLHNTTTDGIGFRMVPDVAYNAGTGVSVYTSFLTADFDLLDDITPYPYGLDSGWGSWLGTSVGAPQWAALFALGNQQRVAAGKSLIGNNAHNLIYTMGTRQSQGSFFQDVTSDDPFDIPNPNPPGPGFDMSTGFGRPHGAIIADGLEANDALVNGSVNGQFTSIYNEASSKYPGGGVQLWADYRGTVTGSVGTNAVSLTFTVVTSYGVSNTFTFTAVVPRVSKTHFSGVVENVIISGPVTTTIFNLKVDGTIALNNAGAYGVSGTFEGLDPLTGQPPLTGKGETYTGRFWK